MVGSIEAAAKGAVVGWTLGTKCRSRANYSLLRFYDPIPPRMAVSDAIEAWLVWSRHLRAGTRPELLGSSLADHWNYPQDETAFGLSNMGIGLCAPISGAYSNPLSTGSRAIGRAVYWGLAFHGRPDEAARYAYFDASIDHTADGVWIPTAVAYALATINPGDPIKRFVDAFIYALPRESKLRGAIPIVLKGVAQTDGPRKLFDSLAESLGVVDPLSAPMTGAWIVAGLVSGNGAFERSVLECSAFGGSSDQAALVAGAVGGLLQGEVPQAWLKPVSSGFVTGHGLKGIDPPSSVEEFASLIALDASQFGYSEPEIALIEGAPQVVSQKPLVPLTTNLTQKQDYFTRRSSDVLVTVRYIASPCYKPSETMNLAIEFTNIGDVQVDLSPTLAAPKNWECAHKIGDFSLLSGGVTSFLAVLRSKGKSINDETLKLSLNGDELPIPLLGPQRWYQVGPLLNQEGTGFDREYPAQTRIALGEVFNGRSDMPVEWREALQCTCELDLESLMAGGPGTAFYYAKVKFPNPGLYRVVVASGVGAILFIDGIKMHWYHDTHTPVPRSTSKYTKAFESSGVTSILIKTFRNLDPVPPMTVYFLSEEGSLVRPIEFVAL